LNTNQEANETKIDEISDEEEHGIFFKTKRAKFDIDYELNLYSSMYATAIDEANPLVFWKSNEKVCIICLHSN
jgi:hypothetical protein